MRDISASLRFSLTVILLLLIAPGEVLAQEATLNEAEEAFQRFEFDTAVELFTRVAEDPTASKEIRREAYQSLGQLYVYQKRFEEAREALERLVALEPPIVELNPDTEPLPLVKLYYEVRKEQNGGYQVERADPGLHTLAIMDFTNASVDEHERLEPLRWGFPSAMINYLNGATDLKVVERERIQWLLDELELQRQGGVVDQSTAVRMGELMGAHTVLFGTYIAHRDEMQISARLVNVETGEILLSEQVRGNKKQFFALVEKLSAATARAINITLEETELGKVGETRSLDAMLSYSEGVSLLEGGNVRAAYEKFQEALDYDSSYARAKLKIQSLEPQLAFMSEE
jgi:tetratricopeptide (TPR) repeat protein